MERLHGLDALPVGAERTVVTVGFFDGVHLGHRAVLGRTVDAARERGLPSVAVTFDRHPREVLTPGREPRLLTTVDRKAALVEETGIDTLLVLEFTEDFSRWPAERFVSDVLLAGLHAEPLRDGRELHLRSQGRGDGRAADRAGTGARVHRRTRGAASRSRGGASRRPRSETRSRRAISSGPAWRSAGGSSWTAPW